MTNGLCWVLDTNGATFFFTTSGSGRSSQMTFHRTWRVTQNRIHQIRTWQQADEVHHFPTDQSLLLEAVAGMFCGSWQNVCACQSAGKTLFCETSHKNTRTHSVFKKQNLHKSNKCSKNTHSKSCKILWQQHLATIRHSPCFGNT